MQRLLSADFREIADAAPVLIWIADVTGEAIWFNRPWLEFAGRTLEEALAQPWDDRIHPEDARRALATYRSAFARREPFRMDHRLRRADGSWRTVDNTGVPRFAADGTFLGYVGTAVDVADQRAAEQALRESEEQLRLATEAAEIGLWDVDLVTDTLFWPARVKAMFGISPQVPVSMRDFYAGLHPGDRVRVTEAFAAATDPARRALYDVEYRTVGKEDGIVRWVAAKGRGIFDADGRCVRVIGTAIDISARKRSDEHLRELNETLEQRVSQALAERKILADLFEATDALIRVIDLDYRLLAINRAGAETFERLYGVRLGLGDSLLDTLTGRPSEQAAVRAAWSRVLAGEAYSTVQEVTDPVLGRRFLEMRFDVLRNARGEQIGAYQFVYDVTERLRDHERLAQAQERLRQAQKIEALGQLTGGVAHDFNNLLQVISGGLAVLERQSDPARSQRALQGMRRATERGASLTRQLLAFSRRQPLNPEPIDISRQIESMRELLERTLRGDVQVRTEFAPDLWPARVDPVELELVVLNLCVNARDAMPQGGRITLSGQNVPNLSQGELQGDFVRLSVTDTGVGMSKEVLAHVFEPFFTTKDVGKGSGLGLAQVYGFATQSGGSVEVHSREGEGTTVTLLLPRSTAAVARREDSLPSGRGSERATTGSILLIEDDDEVAALVDTMLRDLGYTVTRAASPAGALGALADGRTVEVVFSDVMMPGGMNGFALAREIRRRRPGLPILLTSGYAASVVQEAASEGIEVLAKPFALDHLAAALRRAVSGWAPRGAAQP